MKSKNVLWHTKRRKCLNRREDGRVRRLTVDRENGEVKNTKPLRGPVV